MESNTCCAELSAVLPRISNLVEWSRRANAYIDAHNAPPPEARDPATRDELIDVMEELGGLMQRYADSLVGFADRERFRACATASPDADIGFAASGKLLQFPVRNQGAQISMESGVDPAARPFG
ncbi:MAG TPA: hypothetical protein VF292_06705 [Rhodanobacteraceae bacterium]